MLWLKKLFSRLFSRKQKEEPVPDFIRERLRQQAIDLLSASESRRKAVLRDLRKVDPFYAAIVSGYLEEMRAMAKENQCSGQEQAWLEQLNYARVSEDGVCAPVTKDLTGLPKGVQLTESGMIDPAGITFGEPKDCADRSEFPAYQRKLLERVKDTPAGRFVRAKQEAAEKYAEEEGKPLEELPLASRHVRKIDPEKYTGSRGL